jgi:hypothetical protein
LDDLVHPDEVPRNHRDDHRQDDLGRLVVHQLVEVRQLLHHLGEVLRYLKKMDCYLRAVAAAQK